jgi:beta-xylosidase
MAMLISIDLNKHWYHLRTPLKPIHSLSERPDYLTLYGSAYGIGDQESPAMVLRKLPIPCGTWTTEMEFDPASEHEEAGTTVYLSLHSYLALSVRRDADGKRKVTLRWPEDQMETKFVVSNLASW